MISGQFLHLDQFDFQVFEVCIIHVKLAFQGLIRHPPSLPEKSNNLIQYLVKVHHLPLRCQMAPSTYRVRPYHTGTPHGTPGRAARSR